MDIDNLIKCLRNAKEPNMGLTDFQSVEQDAIDAIKMLRAENSKLKEYSRDAHNTLNNMYGAGGRFCDDTISAFLERWRDHKGDSP